MSKGLGLFEGFGKLGVPSQGIVKGICRDT